MASRWQQPPQFLAQTVFDYLDVRSLIIWRPICTAWRKLDTTLDWKHFDVRNRDFSPALLTPSPRGLSRLESLEVWRLKKEFPPWLFPLLSQMKCLRTLRLSCTCLETGGWTAVVQALPPGVKLERIHLSMLSGRGDYQPFHLKYLLGWHKSLTELSLNRADFWDDDWSSLNQLSRVTSLDLYNCIFNSEAAIVQKLASLNNLTQLRTNLPLHNLPIIPTLTHLDPQTGPRLPSWCFQQLLTLKLDTWIHDFTLYVSSHRFKCLTALDLVLRDHDHHTPLQPMVLMCPRLETLKLNLLPRRAGQTERATKWISEILSCLGADSVPLRS